MRVLALAAAFLFLTAAKKAPDKAAADPNAATAKSHGGKVWVFTDAFPAGEGGKLAAWLSQHAPAGEARGKDKDGPWSINYLAVFKKPAAKGPITVRFFEKGDVKNVVAQYSPPNDAAAVVFQASYDLSGDDGFNKGKTYVIKVGQLIKNKFVLYASGEVSLR